jgi:protocatechuate 3,4-dioxygenase beta subunit
MPALPADPFTANFLQLPQPVCDRITPQQTEGPFYKQGSPERKVLLTPDSTGEKLIVAGYVVDQNCHPVPAAWLDFWQADANGVYDNSGYGLRAHQFSDDQGRYFLETVVPGLYTERTEHLHVKIQPPGGQILTTQLYFPNVPQNSADGIFDPALLVTLEEREGLYVAYFDFVIPR